MSLLNEAAVLQHAALDFLVEKTGKSEEQVLQDMQHINAAVYVAVAGSAKERGFDTGLSVEASSNPDEDKAPMVRLEGIGTALLVALGASYVHRQIMAQGGGRNELEKLLEELGGMLRDDDEMEN